MLTAYQPVKRVGLAAPKHLQIRALSQASQGYNSFGAPKHRPQLPISPHVTIYRFPLPAITSIVHRITGTCLALGKQSPNSPNISRINGCWRWCDN